MVHISKGISITSRGMLPCWERYDVQISSLGVCQADTQACAYQVKSTSQHLSVVCHIPPNTSKHFVGAKSLQSCPTLCDPIDCSPPGPSLYGDPPGEDTERVATPASRVSSQRRDRICVSYVSYTGRWVLYHKCHLGCQTLTFNHRH